MAKIIQKGGRSIQVATATLPLVQHVSAQPTDRHRGKTASQPPSAGAMEAAANFGTGHPSEWMEIAADLASLSLESAEVIGLRIAGAAMGKPRATAEAWRMCSEKIIAMAEVQALFLAGSLGASPSQVARKILRHYRAKVATNRTRLQSHVQRTL